MVVGAIAIMDTMRNSFTCVGDISDVGKVRSRGG